MSLLCQAVSEVRGAPSAQGVDPGVRHSSFLSRSIQDKPVLGGDKKLVDRGPCGNGHQLRLTNEPSPRPAAGTPRPKARSQSGQGERTHTSCFKCVPPPSLHRKEQKRYKGGLGQQEQCRPRAGPAGPVSLSCVPQVTASPWSEQASLVGWPGVD